LELKKNYLYFFTETAWHPPFDLLKLILVLIFKKNLEGS